MRCPVCGMLSRLELGFNAAWIGEHKLQEVIQHFVGRGNGANGGAFLWTRKDKSHDPEWVELLLRVLRKVYGDLSKRFKGLGGKPEELIEIIKDGVKPEPIRILDSASSVGFVERLRFRESLNVVERLKVIG